MWFRITSQPALAMIFSTKSPTLRPANAASGLVGAVSRSAKMTGWPGCPECGRRSRRR